MKIKIILEKSIQFFFNKIKTFNSYFYDKYVSYSTPGTKAGAYTNSESAVPSSFLKSRGICAGRYAKIRADGGFFVCLLGSSCFVVIDSPSFEFLI